MGTYRLFLQISRAWKAKINQDKQLDRTSGFTWVDLCPVKVKSYEKRQTAAKIKVSFTEKKVLYFNSFMTEVVII